MLIFSVMTRMYSQFEAIFLPLIADILAIARADAYYTEAPGTKCETPFSWLHMLMYSWLILSIYRRLEQSLFILPYCLCGGHCKRRA